MQKEKALSQLNKVKIFLEVSFLPSVTLSGDQTSTTSTNKTNQSGANSIDSNSDKETKKITVEQKIFSGFKGFKYFQKI